MPVSDVASAGALALLCAGVLTREFTALAAAGTLAAVSFVAFTVFAGPRLRLRERALLAAALLVTAAAARFAPAPGELILNGLGQAAYLAAFMVLLSLLRDAAETSPAVRELGRYLARQPAGRRFAALQLGGASIGAVLNFGVLNLLGPLIQRGVRASGDAAQVMAIRERRQLTALSRGFSWIIAWAPTTITQAVVPVIVTGADSGRIAAFGLVAFVAANLLAWLEDRVRFRGLRARLAAQNLLPRSAHNPLPRAAFVRFGGVCAALAAGASGAVLLGEVGMVSGVMLVAPLITAVWVWRQFPGRAGPRYAAIALRSMPAGAPEAATLSLAGYCGIVGAGVIGEQQLAPIDALATMPAPALCLLLPLLVVLASNLAMPPIFTVTFLGSLLSEHPALAIEPTVLALALVFGWVLNLTASPFSATSLVLARATGIAGTTLSWRWNGLFSALAYVLVCAVLLLA